MRLAARIVAERPTFRLFENNCQNFVKFLLEALCPCVPIPDTINDIVQRLQDISTVARAYNDVLPGAYPASVASSTSTSFVTATGTTWLTASGDTWITALEYLSSNASNSSGSLTHVPQNREPKPNAIFRIAERTLRGKTAIIRAVSEGDVDKVAALLRINADLSVPDKSKGQTPLHIAVEKDNPVILKMLLEAGVDPFPNRWEYDLTGPLRLAIRTLNVNAVSLLLQARSSISVPKMYYPPSVNISPFATLIRQQTNETINELMDGADTELCLQVVTEICKSAVHILKARSSNEPKVSSNTARRKQALIFQMILDAGLFRHFFYGSWLSTNSIFDMAAKRPGTSFNIMKMLMNPHASVKFIDYGFLYSRDSPNPHEFHCGILSEIYVGGKASFNETVEYAYSDTNRITLFAGNLQTLAAFYALWGPTLEEGSYPSVTPIDRQHGWGTVQLHFRIDLDGATSHALCQFNETFCNDKIALLLQKGFDFHGTFHTTAAMIWVDEDCRLEMEMINGERWVRPVIGRIDRVDYDEIWKEAAAIHWPKPGTEEQREKPNITVRTPDGRDEK